MPNRRWFWVFLFVTGVTVVTVLATGWNVTLVNLNHESIPWFGIILGSLGFLGVLTAFVMLFVRLLLEMKLTQRQSEFLATVSHELKTPIATLELSSGLLQDLDDEPARSVAASMDRKRLWHSHTAELKRLKEQVDVLLEAARFQSGGHAQERVEVNLEAWLSESIDRWQRMLGPKANFRREGLPLTVKTQADLRMLNLITDNLIDNARKFARETPTVTVFTETANHQWSIKIRDEGWGFDPKESKRIFKRFTRAYHSAPYAIPGTGLGLYLAYTASRALGLRLEAKSSGPGQGAEFILSGQVYDRA